MQLLEGRRTVLLGRCLGLLILFAPAIGTASDWISTPRPKFPKEALQRGSEGSVKLQIVLTRDGRVAKTQVVRSSGDAVLDAAAQASVANWRMNPAAVKDSDTIKGRIEIIDFKQEPIVGARYPDRAAYFNGLEHLNEFMFAPFPSYPAASRHLNHSGEALLKATTGSDGRVISVELLRSSGYRELDQCAIAAVKLWRVHKQFAGRIYKVPIDFRMRGTKRIPNFW